MRRSREHRTGGGGRGLGIDNDLGNDRRGKGAEEGREGGGRGMGPGGATSPRRL